MSPEKITDHLCNNGYRANLSDDSQVLTIEHEICGKTITLKHFFPKTINQLPIFLLEDADSYGTLAHVEPRKGSTLALVCVSQSDAISVNYNLPTAAYLSSLERHLELLKKAISDPKWNRLELIREFRSNWDLLAHFANTNSIKLYFACDPNLLPQVQVKRPFTDKWPGIDACYLGLDQKQIDNEAFGSFRRSLRWDKRETEGKSVLLHLTKLEPPPHNPDTLAHWYVQRLNHLDKDSKLRVRKLQKQTSRTFWLVFFVINDGGRVWFAIRFSTKGQAKLPLPATEYECRKWTIDPIPVRALDRESVVPRSGGHISLAEISVLLVGCGSVGSELGHRLASTGIGKITLSDPQLFSEDNLYRHTLGIDAIGTAKSFQLALDLRRKYPWIHADSEHLLLQDYTKEELADYDLIVVAIGSPTIERKFFDFVSSSSIDIPVMNVWLEAYGIGGHATLDIPRSSGCLLCAYIDPADFSRGLSSNLNFLEPNQDFTVSMGGCGNLFLPYSALASNHTANMAAELASKYLLGKIDKSSRVSWKGDANEARSKGLTTSYRYDQFDSSFKIESLLNPECDICGG